MLVSIVKQKNILPLFQRFDDWLGREMHLNFGSLPIWRQYCRALLTSTYSATLYLDADRARGVQDSRTAPLGETSVSFQGLGLTCQTSRT